MEVQTIAWKIDLGKMRELLAKELGIEYRQAQDMITESIMRRAVLKDNYLLIRHQEEHGFSLLKEIGKQ